MTDGVPIVQRKRYADEGCTGLVNPLSAVERSPSIERSACPRELLLQIRRRHPYMFR